MRRRRPRQTARRPGSGARWQRFCLAVVVCLAAVRPVPAQAQVASAPDSFAIDTAATGLLIEVSAPAALPLDVVAGVSYAQVGVNSQPRIQSTAAPVFVPLAQDLALLGGTSGVLGIAARLGPGLVVGLPTLVGLPPLPIDPSIVPVDPLANFLTGLPVPPLPPLGCTSNLPDDPKEAECGGGAQDFFGYRVGAASARTVAEGEIDDRSTLASRSDAAVVGVAPSGGQPLAPFSVAAMGATADGRIVDGRAVTTASASVAALDLAGQLGIEAIEASYSGASGGTAETFEESVNCNIVGAELAGQRIELGTDSITVPGQELELPTAGLGGLTDLLGGLGGQMGPVDIGNVTVTPNPEPVVEVSDDGTSVLRRFACLEIRYRILASGTDVRITLGNIAVSLNAQNDAAFSPSAGGGASDVASGGSADLGSTDLGSGGVDLGGSTPTLSDGGDPTGDFALPEPPAAGEEAPEPAAEPFATTANAAGWRVDGGWMAPFALLALSLPLLARARTFAPAPRPTRT